MRQPTGRFFTIGMCLLWTLSLAAACGKALPTSPTPAAAATNSVSAAVAATISGGISGTGGGLSLQSVPQATSGITVSVVGTTISSTLDGNGRFRLLNVAPGNITLQFSGAGVNATVTVGTVTAGDTIEITVALKTNGTSAEIEDSDRRHDDEREIEGIVTSVGAGSFVVAGKTVTVTPATTYKLNGHTGLATDVAAGARVHVKGTATATGVIATDVFIQIAANAPVPGAGNGNGSGHGDDDADDDESDDDDANEFEATGLVSALGGTCPSITFTLNATRLSTSASTRFVLACSSVANGVRVEVKGTRRADGSVAVTRVKRP